MSQSAPTSQTSNSIIPTIVHYTDLSFSMSFLEHLWQNIVSIFAEIKTQCFWAYWKVLPKHGSDPSSTA